MAKSQRLRISALFPVLAAVLICGCANKKTDIEAANYPELKSACVLPVIISNSDPIIEDAEREKLGKVLQIELINLLLETSTLEVRSVDVADWSTSENCDAYLNANVALLQLVEKKDTATSIAATTAGITSP